MNIKIPEEKSGGDFSSFRKSTHANGGSFYQFRCNICSWKIDIPFGHFIVHDF
jgi:hypothetical protein